MIEKPQKPQTQEPPTHPENGPDPQPRPRQINAMLGDKEVVIQRLGTRAGLDVAKVLIRYIVELREPIREAIKNRGEVNLADLKEDETLKVATDMLERFQAVLKEDDFLKVICCLLGQPADVVGDAPLEDTMNALADAFSINNMPGLVKAAGRIFQEVGKMMEVI